MKIGIHWRQASTQRGFIWVLTAFVGAILLYMGKPVDQLILLASGVAGGLGLMVHDE
jgi:hypothetical protein